MQLKFKSKHRHKVGKKIHKTQQNIFRQHTREQNDQGSHPDKLPPERKATSTTERQAHRYNEDRPLFLGDR